MMFLTKRLFTNNYNLIFFTAIVFSFILNEINRGYIQNLNPENVQINAKSLVSNYTIWSIDNDWYLPQIEYFLRGYGYTLDPENEYMRVRRTPGYSIFFGIHRLLFGEKYAFFFVRFTQVLLFALSTVLLGKSAFFLTQNVVVAKTTGFLYALSPFVAGYNYYTITEAIHPAVLIFCLYFFCKAEHCRSRKLFFITGISIGLAVLIRPVDGLILPIFGLIILFNIIKKKVELKKGICYGLLVLTGFLGAMSPWVVRNYIVSNGEIILFEKFYNEDPMIMGKGHAYFRKWWSCWDNPSSELLTREIEIAAMDDIKSEIWINHFVNELPDIAYAGYGPYELKDALRTQLLCSRYKQSHYGGIRVLKLGEEVPECEDAVKQKFSHLISLYRSNNPLQYYLITPLHLAKEFVFQSFSSMLGFLNPEDRNFTWWQVLIKGWMYLLNLSLFISTFLILFQRIDLRIKLLLFGFTATNLLFFVSLGYVENRYLLQAYPIMYSSLAILITNYLSKKDAIVDRMKSWLALSNSK